MYSPIAGFRRPGMWRQARRRIWQTLIPNDWSDGPTPPHQSVLRAPGPNPIRMLLLGGGSATGYGVATHELALAGHLTRQVALDIGRGVDMDVSVAPNLTVSDAHRLAQCVSPQRYEAVVLVVGVQDALDGQDPETWATQMQSLIARFTASSDGESKVFVVSVPAISAIMKLPGSTGRSLDAVVRSFNDQLELLAAVNPTLCVVPFDVMTAPKDTPLRSSGTYRVWAGLIAPTVSSGVALSPGKCAAAPPEVIRGEAVAALGALGTAPDQRFDKIVATAQRRFHSAGAAISFMDEKRQWFKSVIGVQGESVPRGRTFYEWTIQGAAPFVVFDASKDPRFSELAIVVEGHIRTYAGHPILDPSGVPVGVICVLFTEPRTLDAQDLQFLRDLAGLAEKLLLSPLAP